MNKIKTISSELIKDTQLLKFLKQATNISLVMYSDEKIIFANKGAEELLGMPEAELIGKNILDFAVDEYKQLVKMNTEARNRGEKVENNYQVKIKLRSGEEKWVSAYAERIHYENQEAVIVTLQDFTNQYQVNDIIHKKEHYYSALINHSQDVILVLDRLGRVKYVSPSFEQVSGYKIKEVLGKSILTFLAEDEKRTLYELFLQSVEHSEQSFRGHLSFYHKNGYWFQVEALITNFLNAEHIKGIIINARDITDINRARENLEKQLYWQEALNYISQLLMSKNLQDSESLEIFRQIFTASYVCLLELDPISNQFNLVFESRDDTFACKPVSYLNHFKLFELCLVNEEDFIRGIQPDILLEPDIETPNCLFSIVPIKQNEEIYGALLLGHVQAGFEFKGIQINLLRDIIYSYLKRRKTQHFNYLLSGAMKSIREAIAISDLEGNFIFVNDIFEQIFGFSRSELLGQTFPIVASGEATKELLLKISERTLKYGRWKGELMLTTRAGLNLPVYLQSSIIFNESGEQIALLFILSDISHSKLQEKILRESEEKYRMVVEHSLNAIYIIQDGKFIYVNKSFEEITGYSTEEIVGKLSPNDLTFREDQEMVQQNINARLTGKQKSIEYEFRIIRKDGNVIPVKVAGSLVTINDKPSIFGSLLDLSREKQLEQQLIQAQKMESVGRLAGGVAHDFNNILSSILGYASLMKVKLGADNTYNRYLDTIVQSAERAAELTKNLLTFSRGGDLKTESFDLNNLIRETVKLLNSTFEKTIKISVDLDENIPRLVGDSTQIQQILINLGVNARDAITIKGEIKISTSLTELTESVTVNGLRVEAGEYVLLKFEDNGHGMDEQLQSKIFEPFFTTKDVGKGTGLGLSIVYGVVKNHNGLILVNSKLNKGTTFKIFLPINGDQIELEERTKEIDDKIEGKNQKILIIDDEENIRQLMMEVLAENNYQVDSAAGAQEGLEMIENNRYDLIILDMLMPEMTGYDFFEQIKNKPDRPKVIVATGYSSLDQIEEMKNSGIEGLIAKPFQFTDMLHLINEVLS